MRIQHKPSSSSYTHQIQWTEQTKRYGKVTKQFKTTSDAVKMHEQSLTNNPEVLAWKTTRITYNKETNSYETTN